MTLQILLAILGSIGGWEAIKYILDWIKKRKSTKKIDEAEAIAATTTISDKAIEILKDQLLVLDDRLRDKESRITELENQVKELRKTIDDNYREMSKMRAQIDKVCLRYECVNRVRVSDIEIK